MGRRHSQHQIHSFNEAFFPEIFPLLLYLVYMLNQIPRILIVDDQELNRSLLIDIFQPQGYELLQALNGEEGCKMAEQELPDVIIMDWTMPIMNGIDATLRIKSNSSTKDIPILMTTGIMDSADNLKEAMEAGAIDFVRKPFNKTEIEARVQTALRLSNSYQELKQKKAEIETLVANERKMSEGKDRELTLQALYTNETQVFLDEITDELKKIQKQPSTDAIGDVIRKLNSRKDMGKTWDAFMYHFENVHPEFFTKLKVRFTDLTNHDLKLCAYVKIGMGNKEIASIMAIGQNSLKSSLYRLKKKLGLGADDKLRDFLIKFR